MPSATLAFMGFGNVGRALAQLLLDRRDELRRRYDLVWQVRAVATGSHGSAIDPDGIDLAKAIQLAERGEGLDGLSTTPVRGAGVDFVRACGAEVLFENTPVNYASGQPAIAHIQAALESGMHVVTANKGPVVHAYRSLTQLARQHGRRFLFESTVMDGAPIFSLWRRALPGCTLNSFRGVLNSTTNLILTLMEGGMPFNEAVRHCQSIGIAETDPSGDILGWDAAVKVAALVTVLMDHPMTPAEVDRKGIEELTPEKIDEARRGGKRWRLICSGMREGEDIRGRVHPELVDAQDPLFNVTGTSSSITFHSDSLGPLTIIEENPGPRTTAYGLLADFVNAVVD
jgi:homoserine dehydrogenase